MGEMRIVNWLGYEIRFIEQDGEWWAILKDICDVLDLRTDKVAYRLDHDMKMRVKVVEDDSRVVRSRGENKTRWMLVVNEEGVYEALYASRRPEARKFRRWVAGMLQRLRENEGLEGYEVMRWWAILKDICDALGLKTFKVSQRLYPSMMTKVPVEKNTFVKRDDIPSRYNVSEFNKTYLMLAVNEIGIYETLFSSNRLEARKLRLWMAEMLQNLRKNVGLEGYEVMRMTEQGVQEEINHLLDDIFYDEERGTLMQMVTLPGGDADAIPCKYWPR